MIAIGDPGLAGVELSAPADFEVELVGDDMQESKRDGRQVFTATAIDAPGRVERDGVRTRRHQARRAGGRRRRSGREGPRLAR